MGENPLPLPLVLLPFRAFRAQPQAAVPDVVTAHQVHDLLGDIAGVVPDALEAAQRPDLVQDGADAARVSSVSTWMTADPEAIHPDAPAAEALDRMLFGGFRHLPVVDGSEVVGVVSMRDLARRLSAT